MFPGIARSKRGRRMLSVCLWLLGAALLVGVVVALLYLVYQQELT